MPPLCFPRLPVRAEPVRGRPIHSAPALPSRAAPRAAIGLQFGASANIQAASKPAPGAPSAYIAACLRRPCRIGSLVRFGSLAIHGSIAAVGYATAFSAKVRISSITEA